MVVMVIIAIMAAAVYPSVASGLDGIRLTSATSDLASFLNAAIERANRRQIAIEVAIDPATHSFVLHSTEPGFEKRFELPESIVIEAVLPELPQTKQGLRRFVVYPGGNVPRIGVIVASRNGSKRLIQVDPITGTPSVKRLDGTPDGGGRP